MIIRWRVKESVGLALVLFVAGALSQVAAGQGAERERIIDEPFRLTMDEQIPAEKRAVLDWGGWYRSSYWALYQDVDREKQEELVFDPDEVDKGYHAYRRQQLRIWGNLNIDQVHQFYARMKLDYWDWNHGTSYNHNDSDWEGPDLDRGWYDFRLSRYRAAYGQAAEEWDVGLKVGRQYVEFGNGLALSLPLDAALVNGYYGDWQVTVLGALSVPSTYNIDRSVPDNSKESRKFWGVQIRYNGWKDHEPFVYYLSQDDQDAGKYIEEAENGEVVRQIFGYDSRYIGAGSRGRFFHKDLQYSTEAVLEVGKSYGWSHADEESNSRQNIQAWAFDNELRYVAPDVYHSQIELEYLLASGDSDRYYSPTNTLGGNKVHTQDHSFVGWGFRNTGVTFAPMISNLGMVRLGGSTFPMAPQKGMLKDLQLGTNMYVYHKQQSGGAASDNFTLNDNSYLGSEFDFFMSWQMTSDLSWMAYYSLFFPGDAYIDRSDQQSLFTGVTVSF